MANVLEKQVERVTVYLTPRNKKRLAGLRRGEKTKKLNEALDKAFAVVERKQSFEKFMDSIESIEPVESKVPSSEVLRLIREGSDQELIDLKGKSR